MSYQHILVERRNGVAWITLNRPPLNILTIAMMGEIMKALEDIAADPDVSLVVFTGAGDRAFCAGVDVTEHLPAQVREMITAFHDLFRQLIALPQPTVAAVRGFALGGGCELALFCDLVVATDNAQFGQPEIKLGLFPPIAVLILPRLLPRKKGVELLLNGERLSAREAEGLGLVNRVVPNDRLEEETTAFLSTITPQSAAALRFTKRAIIVAHDRDFAEALARVEALYLDELMATHDAEEGLQSFLEKRPPVWRNR